MMMPGDEPGAIFPLFLVYQASQDGLRFEVRA
jgi:hypothetical protein